MSVLAQAMLSISPNGVFPGKKIKIALEKMQKEGKHRLNNTKVTDNDFWVCVKEHVHFLCSSLGQITINGTKQQFLQRKHFKKQTLTSGLLGG